MEGGRRAALPEAIFCERDLGTAGRQLGPWCEVGRDTDSAPRKEVQSVQCVVGVREDTGSGYVVICVLMSADTIGVFTASVGYFHIMLFIKLNSESQSETEKTRLWESLFHEELVWAGVYKLMSREDGSQSGGTPSNTCMKLNCYTESLHCWLRSLAFVAPLFFGE